jgi:hypothetical protein
MPGGNASFYKRAVGSSWSGDVSGKTSTSSIAASEMGIEVSEADRPQIYAILQSAAQLASAELEGLF